MKKVLAALAALLVAAVVVVAMQPSEYHVERSIVVNAPARVVWRQIADFERWVAWNPWQKADPEQKTEISGDAGEVGHQSAWDGENSGKGTMTITEVDKPKHLGIELVFESPMQSKADTAFDLVEEEEGVKVTWSMDGEHDFPGKVASLLMGMEAMIGNSYEQGLGDLKIVSEKRAKGVDGVVAAAEETAEKVAGAAAEGAEKIGAAFKDQAGKVAGAAAKMADAVEGEVEKALDTVKEELEKADE